MKIPKTRLLAFSDGVIAIAITIMALGIPLPTEMTVTNILHLMGDITVYFLSFVVVGAFWSQHHRAFSYLEEISNKVIVANMFFLFFLSLIPMFTKMVMENTDVLFPGIGFDCVYLLVQFSYMMIFQYVLRNSEHEEIKRLVKMRESMRENRDRPQELKSVWLRFGISFLVIGGSIALALTIPAVSGYFLLWLPVASSVFNLFFEVSNRQRDPLEQSAGA